jgi:uncharacterized protein
MMKWSLIARWSPWRSTGRAAVLICVIAIGGPDALAETKRVPDPLGYVSDYAAVFDEDWKGRTRSVCQDLERKTGVEMVIVTVPDLGAYRTVNEYASALYQRWGIGSTHRDHGVLILVVTGEHRATVTLGRALLMVITAGHLEDIRNRYLDPMFRSGRYGESLYRAAVALASVTQQVEAGGETRRHIRGLGFWLTVLTAAGALAFLWWISRPDLRHPFGKLRRGEFWGSGQGGFGGNFGGFGGGTSGEEWR